MFIKILIFYLLFPIYKLLAKIHITIQNKNYAIKAIIKPVIKQIYIVSENEQITVYRLINHNDYKTIKKIIFSSFKNMNENNLIDLLSYFVKTTK